MAGEIEFGQRIGRRCGDVVSGDHRQCEVRVDRPSHHSKALDDSGLRKQVFHEISRPQKKSIQLWDLRKSFFQYVESGNRPRLVRFISAKTAESYDMSNARGFESTGDGICYGI